MIRRHQRACRRARAMGIVILDLNRDLENIDNLSGEEGARRGGGLCRIMVLDGPIELVLGQ